ncbi:hypothetical protein Bca52824_026929 [Brassica carinata]|uniref:Uncharacterized protein n=1 Tax=Brassica carinata TaxID=52824 RepID=A0A8X7SIL0_BRACI|nr:hypothetical protein Bca52824_026929 [Brassica carinata]
MSRSPSHHHQVHHHHKIRLLLELKQSRDLRRSLGDRDQNLMESLISEAQHESLCLFLKLPNPPFHDNLNDLYRFFASKFVTFVGVQIEEDLNLLREPRSCNKKRDRGRTASCEGSRDSAAHRVLLKVDSDKDVILLLRVAQEEEGCSCCDLVDRRAWM